MSENEILTDDFRNCGSLSPREEEPAETTPVGAKTVECPECGDSIIPLVRCRVCGSDVHPVPEQKPHYLS